MLTSRPAARHASTLLSTPRTHCARRALTLTAATAASTPGAASSVNAAEIAHFSRLSSQWWDERGEFGLLHAMNPVRVSFIRQKVLETARAEHGEAHADALEHGGRVLRGMDVLDVGCGGGLLSETLARLGARTTGVDASESNIAIASLHAAQDPLLRTSPSPSAQSDGGRLEYRHTSAETLLQEPKRFDAVCALEVLEHVDNPAAFLATCAELVKPGGHLFLSTIARTPLAYLLTIFAAEHALRLVTPGTHTLAKYVNPAELVEFFARYPSAPASTSLSAAADADAPPARLWITQTYGRGEPVRTEAEVRGLVYVPWKGWELVSRADSTGLMGWATTQCNYIFWVRRPFDN